EKGALNLWKACTIALEYSPAKTDCYNRFYIPSKWSWLFNQKQECAKAHSRACGGRLRHLHYTSQWHPRGKFFTLQGAISCKARKKPEITHGNL
ncbi:hypothetical protein LK520_16520, partial [Blautia sp. DFI.4.84]|nr:hypothetical protein [Blautia sp. DFI.4.84]